MPERNVLVVDWSANSKPKTGADSIWIGDAYGNRVNPSTRVEAIEFLKRLISQKGDEQKWLIAFDFSFGVPGWSELGEDDVPTFWEEVYEYFLQEFKRIPQFKSKTFDFNNESAALRWKVANDLNRAVFKQKKFWGCPKDLEKGLDDLSSKKGDRKGFSDEKRSTDSNGAKSPWQLLGAGSVGSQMLMGICHLQRWRKEKEWADKISVWPFEESNKQIVFAETFPSHEDFAGENKLIDQINNHRCGLVKDAVQVTAVANCLQQALPNLDAAMLDEPGDDAQKEGLILTPDQELLDKLEWNSARLDELFLGPGEGPCEWIGLLNKVSRQIEPSTPPTKRTTPD